MRNHDQKVRDMARSVLPSTAAKGARAQRTIIHRRERAHIRAELHELRSFDDLDDYAGDLCWQDRRAMEEMVRDRRSHDKLGPFITWALRTAETDRRLRDADPDDRLAHFRALLPDGLIGWHACTHLEYPLGVGDFRWRGRRRRSGRTELEGPARDMALAILAGGYHGELNRRIRANSPRFRWVRVWVPPRRVVDGASGPAGRLVPGAWEEKAVPLEVRFLLGEHDIDAYIAAQGSYWIRDLYSQLVRDRLLQVASPAPPRSMPVAPDPGARRADPP